MSTFALGYIEIAASDLNAWSDYATQVLGVECIEEQGGLNLRYDDHPWRIRIVPGDTNDIVCAAFEFATPNDLEATVNRLQNLGIEVAQASDAQAAARGVTKLMRCQDPDGLNVELYTGNRNVKQACSLPFESTQFVTGAQGLGHMVLTTQKPSESEAFYMQGLGFLLSDHILLGPIDRQVQLTFLHCNPRHHTIALAPIPAPKRLNHFMLQVTNMDAVGYGLDRAQAAGLKITSSLGKHTNDHMISFYMRTPSGFDVEYGYGGIEIDDATWQPDTHTATSFWGHN